MNKIDLIKSQFTELININKYLQKDGSLFYRVLSIIEIENLNEIYFLVVQTTQFNDFIEEQKNLNDIFKQKKNSPEDEKYKEACETILNTDPFGGHHSGKKLIDIFKNDRLWVDMAFRDLKNKYILEKLKIIKEYNEK